MAVVFNMCVEGKPNSAAEPMLYSDPLGGCGDDWPLVNELEWALAFPLPCIPTADDEAMRTCLVKWHGRGS